MTLEELAMLNNAVLDGTEAYVDERLKPENLPFSRNEIGTVMAVEEDEKHHRYHTIRVGSTTRYKKYKRVQSVGNVLFEEGAVVLILIPSGQDSQAFILGRLDFTPAAIIGGTINIGEIPGSDPLDYYFKVDANGHVSIKSGGFEYGWNEELQDYTYRVDNTGVHSGIYRNEKGKKDWYFNVDNEGKVSIKGYLQDGAFNTKDPTNATTIDGAHISTGYIKSPTLRPTGVEYSSFNNDYTNAGMIIGLQEGFISTKNFRISSNGDAYFKGHLEAQTGKIGNWSISKDELFYAYTSTKKVVLKPNLLKFISSTGRTTALPGRMVILSDYDSKPNTGLIVSRGDSFIETGDPDGGVGGQHVWISSNDIEKYDKFGNSIGSVIWSNDFDRYMENSGVYSRISNVESNALRRGYGYYATIEFLDGTGSRAANIYF